MEGFEKSYQEPAKGFGTGLHKRVVVSFDDETFAQIRKRAVRGRRSFAAEVRDLVELGLES